MARKRSKRSSEVRLEVSAESDFAYLRLTNVGAGGVHSSIPIQVSEPGLIDTQLVIDVDKDGRMVGIEILENAREVLPKSVF